MSNDETCVATDSGSVTCTISSSAVQTDLTEVLTSAQALNSALSTSSSMIIIAYGGAGGRGKDYSGGSGGSGGQGGMAQMTTSLDSFRKAYNGSMLYFYFGAQGSTEHWGGKGGSSTVVSVANLNMEGASTANVVLCAGGGGGGGAANKGPGYGGGNGGSATSSLGQAATGAGHTGSSNPDNSFYANPSGGAGGSNGAGGAGGAANDTKVNIAGKDGGDGMGGMGGPVHLGDGPSSPTLWTNFTQTAEETIDGVPIDIAVPIGLTGGEGGEGECREGGDIEGQPDSNMIAEGGGGGGGYGGGGGGGGGLYEDSETGSDTSSAGGGGGGSYAAASTITRVAPPYTVPSFNTGDGYVMIIFP
jgi:hypothetical protein